MLAIFISLIGSIVWSGFVAGELGAARYGTIAIIAFLVLLGLFIGNEHAHRKLRGDEALVIEQPPRRAVVDLFTQVALAGYFAATWPALPLIVWIGKWTRGDEEIRAASSARRS